MIRTLVPAGILLTLVVSLSAQQRQATPPAPGASPGTAAPLVTGDPERGRYIVERVAMCVECHSGRDSAGNIVPSQRLLGGSMPVSRFAWASDWPTVIPRIAGLPGYTDEFAMRLLTQGAIKRDGTQLRAPMPKYRMATQDAADVVAYLRAF